MAKRKNRPGGGLKLHPIIDYREDKYIPYIHSAETGILEAWTIDPDIRDGDVREVLRGLIKTIKRNGQLPAPLTTGGQSIPDAGTVEEVSSEGSTLLETFLLRRLSNAFQNFGPLNTEETIGILGVINHSVGTWNRGLRGQEYLKYIKGFLGATGVNVRKLTEEEVAAMGLIIEDDENYDDDDVIEGDYHEIK